MPSHHKYWVKFAFHSTNADVNMAPIVNFFFICKEAFMGKIVHPNM